MDKSRAVYGIDLGTTYSCISQVDKFDQAIVIRNFEGDATTPSVVYFEGDRVIVGKEAKEMLTTEPENTVAFVKREMGVDASFDKTTNQFPYHYDPSEISSFILRKLVQDANSLGDNPEPIRDVVITCPAYFGTKEKMQTKQAGETAELNVLAIINEPTAAAIAYGVKLNEPKRVLVYDLGGGTFDVTMINVDNGAIKVIATGGNHHLGGADWDRLLAEYALDVFNEQNGTSYSLDDDVRLKNRLLLDAEMKKKQLTAKSSVKWNIDYEGCQARVEITRELFDSLTEDRLNDTITYTRNVLEIAEKKGYKGVDEILLVGGSSRMPQVKERLDREFNLDTKLTDPDECVAKGAAIYAMNEAYRQAVVDYEEGESDTKPAPIRGDRTTVVNVTSKTYGADVLVDGELKVQNIIFANTSLPTKRTMIFSTSVENQQVIALRVEESDFTDMEKDEIVEKRFCTEINQQPLRLTKQWPKGTPVSVTYAVDSEGILHVNASVDKDVIDFDMEIKGVKNQEELDASRELLSRLTVE